MYDSGSDSDYLTPDESENEVKVLPDFNRNANLDMHLRAPTTSSLNHVRDRLLALSTSDAGLSPFSMERRLLPIDDSGVEKTADVVGDLRKSSNMSGPKRNLNTGFMVDYESPGVDFSNETSNVPFERKTSTPRYSIEKISSLDGHCSLGSSVGLNENYQVKPNETCTGVKTRSTRAVYGTDSSDDEINDENAAMDMCKYVKNVVKNMVSSNSLTSTTRKCVEDLRCSLLDILTPELPMKENRYKPIRNVQFKLGETLKEPEYGYKSRHHDDTVLRGLDRTYNELFHATESDIVSSPVPASSHHEADELLLSSVIQREKPQRVLPNNADHCRDENAVTGGDYGARQQVQHRQRNEVHASTGSQHQSVQEPKHPAMLRATVPTQHGIPYSAMCRAPSNCLYTQSRMPFLQTSSVQNCPGDVFSTQTSMTRPSIAPAQDQAHYRRTEQPTRPTVPEPTFGNMHLIEMLSRLDSRQVPKPDAFDDTTGQSLDEFLISFEDYCTQNFKGGPNLWIRELGALLSGDMKMAYEILRVPGDSYQHLREKLRNWRKENKETIEQQSRARFNEAKMLPKESCRLYAGRLEKLYRFAYPQKSARISTSKALQRKYIETVPEEFSRQVITAKSFNKTMQHAELLWNDILILASQYDADSKLYNKGRDKTEDNEIWLAHGQPKSTVHRERTFTGTSYEKQQGSQSSGMQLTSTPASDQSRNKQTDELPQCFYCEKPGHMKKDCRRFLRQCLVCASPDHRVSQCPHRWTDWTPRSRTYGGQPLQHPPVTQDLNHRDNSNVKVSPSGN